MKTIHAFLSIFFLALGISFLSCSKDEPILPDGNVKQVKLYLTDDPLDAEEVNIEILSVILKGAGKEEIELNTLAGVYNLLAYTGDLDTLIASGNYDLDKLKEIILVLGDENSIVIDGQSFPLLIPNDRKMVRLKVDLDMTKNVLFDLLVDFDACESVRENNGTYTLSPVIRFKGDRNKKTLDKSVIVAITDCYEINFPVTVIKADETETEIDDFSTLIEAYDSSTIFGVKYPLSVTSQNGNVENIRNGNQAEKLIKMCKGGVGKELAELLTVIDSCFEIIYPIQVIDKDNNVIFIDALDVLFDTDGVVDFVYPFFIENPQGDSIPINNLNQIKGRLNNCLNGEVDGIPVADYLDTLAACYTLHFPIRLKLEDGMKVEINSLSEINTLASKPFSILFPIYIQKGDNEKTKISSVQQIKKYIKKCGEVDIDVFNVLEYLTRLESCVLIDYPIVGITESGKTYDIDSLIEITLIDEKTVSLLFPFKVTKGDQKITVESARDIKELIKNCGDGEEIAFAELVGLTDKCYDFVFPLEVMVKDDSVFYSVSDIDELWKMIEELPVYSFAYPIEIIDEDGKSKRINNTPQLQAQAKKCDRIENDLITLLNKCYEFTFPVKVKTKGNEIKTATSLEELKKIWQEYDNAMFVFPIVLTDEMGNVKEIKNQGKLNDALKNCQ